MNFVLATLTVVFLSICGHNQYTIKENQEIQKDTKTIKKESIKYKKVPTKWIKITKISN